MQTKKQMISFINSFELYPTMNSWNGSYGYSYNVKIHHLPFTSRQCDVLYEAINTDGFYSQLEDTIREWEEDMKKHGTHSEKKEIRINVEGKTEKERKSLQKLYEKNGYTFDRCGTTVMTLWKQVDSPLFIAGFNGRMGGHLVLYRWNGHNHCGTGYSHSKEELEEMTKEEVKEIYDVLKDFEKLYNSLLAQCKDIADNMEVKDEDYTITKTRKVLTKK